MTLLINVLAILFLVSIVMFLSTPQTRARNLVLLGLGCYVLFSAFACAFNATQAIDTLVPIIDGLVPLVAAAASLLLPAEATAINAAVPIVVNGLNELKSCVDQYNATPNATTLAKVSSVATVVQGNIADLEAAGQVKDPATKAKIGAIVTLAKQTVAAIESWIQQKNATAQTKES